MKHHYDPFVLFLSEFRKYSSSSIHLRHLSLFIWQSLIARFIYFAISFLITSQIFVYSQMNIALQNFESSGSNYSYLNTNGILQTGNSTASDRPAAAVFYISSNTGFRVTNATATLNFENITGLIAYQFKKVTFRLAAFSIGSTGNGMDAADKVTISVSLNGGATFSDELTVKGNSNAFWHYSSGVGMATVNYDGNNTATEFAPGSGGNRTLDGYSTLTIQLPDTCHQAKLKIVMNNDSNNEAWLIDDVILSGCVAPFFTSCPSNTTINTDPPFCYRQLDYDATASGAPSPILSYVYSGATVGSGSGTGSGSNFNSGITTATIAATNLCGNAICTFMVTVIDKEVPVLKCPAPVSYTTATGSCGPVAKTLISLGTATASDNCDIASLIFSAPDFYPLGVTSVVWTCTDIYSNSNTCVQNVTIIPYKCGYPTQVYHTNLTDSSATIKWKTNTCVSEYQLRIRKEISTGVWGSWSDWTNSNKKLEYVFSGLQASSFYNYQIRSICGSTFSIAINDWFNTKPVE